MTRRELERSAMRLIAMPEGRGSSPGRRPGARQATIVFAGVLAGALLGGRTAFGDAWGASWGRLDAFVSPSGGSDSVVWNVAEPDKWLLHAEADVRHMHPPLSINYGADSEVFGAGGDGIATIGTVTTGDLSRVLSVTARVQSTGGPYVDINAPQDVYSYAHDIPNSTSDAAGLGQHDNLFFIQYGGTGSPPATTLVNFVVQGPWSLAGHSDPDDNWWADWFGYAEVYDSAASVLASASDYHTLAGPGDLSAGGTSLLQFSVTLAYNTPYALRFYLDLETHAEAVPEPGTLLLLMAGVLGISRRAVTARCARRSRESD